jgi:hypothetical protein
MRTINSKFFLALLIGTVVCGGAIYGIHYFQYERIARALLWQARHAEEKGDTQRSVQYLQRYLEFRPRDQAEKITLARTWTSDAFATTPRSAPGRSTSSTRSWPGMTSRTCDGC